MIYKVNSSDNIKIKVVYESELISYWNGPNKKGDNASLKYPDGEIVLNAEIEPKYHKLIKIRNYKQIK